MLFMSRLQKQKQVFEGLKSDRIQNHHLSGYQEVFKALVKKAAAANRKHFCGRRWLRLLGDEAVNGRCSGVLTP